VVDDTVECPGTDVTCATCTASGCDDGVPNDSRLGKVKQAASDLVAAFGSVDYALVRMHQDPAPFTCPDGGWSGASTACAAEPVGTGSNRADLLADFAPDSARDALQWLNRDDDFTGTPPDTGCTLCSDCAGGCDEEVRGSGESALAGMLASARQHIQAAMAADLLAECRSYAVFLFTDGQNTCDGDPATEAAALCAMGVPVLAVGFAAPDLWDELAAVANVGCGPGCDDADGDGLLACDGDPIPVDNDVALSLAMADIVRDTVRAEQCNGIDDDCDGLTDERFPELGQPCGVGGCAGVLCCVASGDATTCCGSSPACEICNGIDDDCDGVIDNNVDVDCDGVIDSPPVICPCFPEVCNGYDDDCNCPGDTNGDGCVCCVGDAGVDDVIGDGYPCGRDVGECQSGVTCCLDGAPSCCGEVGPALEVCDCLDNDCNGLTDELPARPCYDLGDGCDPEAQTCKGICQLGHHVCGDLDPGPGCIPGMTSCLGQRGPEPEECNCVDDDCDGDTDEEVVCPGGGRCENCACPENCDPCVDSPCPAGFICQCGSECDCALGDECPDDCFCQVDRCIGVSCDDCFTCDPTSFECVPVCDTLGCEAGQECRCDRCVDLAPDAGSPDNGPQIFRVGVGGSGGCDCALNPHSRTPPLAWFGLALLVGLAARRRRRTAA